MAEETAWTILDYLNEDCWRLVLDYVPLRDVMRTESASRRWQRAVLAYLSNVRFGILYPEKSIFSTNINRQSTGIVRNVRWITLNEEDSLSFERWTKKLGKSVVAGYCSRWNLDTMGENCPNLEGVKFIDLLEEELLNSQYENFTRLRQICFEKCFSVSDRCVNQFIRSAVLEELEIFSNHEVTGECLINIQSTNFKSLVLTDCCVGVHISHLIAARDRFINLKKLVLYDIRLGNGIIKEVLTLMEKTPNLEYLHTGFLFSGILEEAAPNFFELLYGLRKLKCIRVDAVGTNEILENVTRCCPELRHLQFQKCPDVTGRGLAAACRNAGARLAVLGVPYSSHLTDDDVVDCIRACPNLTELDVLGCDRLTRALLPRAAAARRDMRARRRMQLRSDLDKYEEEFGWDWLEISEWLVVQAIHPSFDLSFHSYPELYYTKEYKGD